MRKWPGHGEEGSCIGDNLRVGGQLRRLRWTTACEGQVYLAVANGGAGRGLKVCCLACLVGMRPGLVDPGMKASVGELLRQKVGSACEPWMCPSVNLFSMQGQLLCRPGL